MADVLVVGATGQLGSRAIQRLVGDGKHVVRALVRPRSSANLPFSGAHCHAGDLRDMASLKAACAGVDTVIATATVVFPKGNYDFRQDEERGYANLIAACLDAGVGHIVFVSLCVPFERRFTRISATYAMKERIEEMLAASGIPHTILRCAPFMDDYFALIGSRIPLAGETAATLDRSRGLTRRLRHWMGDSIERRGVAVAPGPSTRRHAFVALQDVVGYLVGAVDQPPHAGLTLEIGGPEVLSWREVSNLYAQLLQRDIGLISIPAWLLAGLAWVIRPWSAALANQMAILHILGGNDTHVETGQVAGQYGVQPLTARVYLEGKGAAYGLAQREAVA
ncbi:NmrA family NAD(P)-binding protein [Luteibacter aegosomatis]|uniref:SDR family oxidoreductase n=1 Tax=Luteibacter aegosomatis TaxID=2911537 RepID=UPI001FF942EA|nr:NmrA family NAD(P)-binding protein [Luteibacter aegosomatis]UPG85805.1 NmrA family NAD(P)-binding protein [Luteibacter aegosomatis]